MKTKKYGFSDDERLWTAIAVFSVFVMVGAIALTIFCKYKDFPVY